MPIVVLIVLQNVVGLEPRNIGVSLVTGNPNLTNNAQLEKYCEGRDVQRSNGSSRCFENLGICDFVGNFKPYEFNWVSIKFNGCKFNNPIKFGFIPRIRVNNSNNDKKSDKAIYFICK